MNLIIRLIVRVKKDIERKKVLKNFRKEFDHFNSLDKKKRIKNEWKDIYPCLHDNTLETYFDAHYTYHPAWAARVIKKINPPLHTDISSTLHFSTIVSAFIPVDFFDYRPANLNLSNLNSMKCDLNNLHFNSNSLESLSCMHTIEHIGLGRYGDHIDPEGDLKAIEELKRVCAPNGSLLIVVPVGIERIQFNAHRVYDPKKFVKLLHGFKLNNFSLIDDEGQFIENADLEVAASQIYGCGCFWFIKDNI